LNIDITADLIPVRPAAHYAMGGIATDLHGASSLEGLYAAGEVAATGVHGANRLASNSLLEDLVFGARAAAAMVEQRAGSQGHGHAEKAAPKRARVTPAAAMSPSSQKPKADDELEKIIGEVRSLLWDKVGIIREGNGLSQAVERLEEISIKPSATPCRRHYEDQNILQVARLIARSALAREESRGAHYRSDFPLKNAATPPQHSYISKNSEVSFE
jgi:L-aspartate oxidase